MVASYSCKAVGSHIDTLNFHIVLLHNFIAYYNMVGFNRHKYKGAEPVPNSYYRSRRGSSHALLLALTGSRSLSMAGTMG